MSESAETFLFAIPFFVILLVGGYTVYSGIQESTHKSMRSSRDSRIRRSAKKLGANFVGSYPPLVKPAIKLGARPYLKAVDGAVWIRHGEHEIYLAEHHIRHDRFVLVEAGRSSITSFVAIRVAPMHPFHNYLPFTITGPTASFAHTKSTKERSVGTRLHTTADISKRVQLLRRLEEDEKIVDYLWDHPWHFFAYDGEWLLACRPHFIYSPTVDGMQKRFDWAIDLCDMFLDDQGLSKELSTPQRKGSV